MNLRDPGDSLLFCLERCIDQELCRLHEWEATRSPEASSEEAHIADGVIVGELIAFVVVGLVARGVEGRQAAYEMMRRLERAHVGRGARLGKMLRTFAHQIQLNAAPGAEEA
jgi:hypothetical protein